MIELLLTYGEHPDDSSGKGPIGNSPIFCVRVCSSAIPIIINWKLPEFLHVKLIDFYSSSLDNPSDLTVE